ncbi:MAG: hypothetical protein GY711_32765 [bacterium]|nr:hypothetical protein [bacterium]
MPALLVSTRSVQPSPEGLVSSPWGRLGACLCLCLCLCLWALTSSCYIQTQRFPAPMPAAVDPLPDGTILQYPAGPEEVMIVRHADPVQVRPPGQRGSFPLQFYDKRIRVNSGAWVFTGASGRSEVIYSDGSIVLLFGLGSGVIGSRSRGEPMFIFMNCERASIMFGEEDRVQLLGGAILRASGGPFVLERVEGNVVRLRNRSKGGGVVQYREETIRLDPGQVVDLPLLEAGSHPLDRDPSFQTLDAAGVPLQLTGELEVVPDASGTRLRAVGEHEIRGMGLVLRLDPGDEVAFSDLQRVTTPPPDDPAPPSSSDAASDPPVDPE